jgi:peptidoglycan/LPS O-acetylase OafA/YrhL
MGDVLAIGALVVLAGALAWALYQVFGPQIFGLPVLIGVLVVAAGASIFSNAGLVGVLAVVVGLAALVMVIGMAMNVGAKKSDRVRDERPPDERQR